MAVAALFGAGNSTTATSAAASTLSVAKPANVTVGDVLFGVFYSQFAGVVTSAPAGWTLIHTFASKAGGVYYLPVPDSTVLSALPSNWSITISGGGRMALDVCRLTGVDTAAPIDAAGTEGTQGTSPVTAPSITVSNLGSLLMQVTYWNNSSTTQSTVTPDAAMTDGEQVKSPTTGNTSGIDTAYQILAATGATGTRSASTSPASATSGTSIVAFKAISQSASTTASTAGTGAFAATAVQAYSVAAAFTGSGLLVASAGNSANATVNMVGFANFTVTYAPNFVVTVAFGGTGGLVTRNAVESWMAAPMPMAAHRGGSADWPEETLFAYANSAAWNSKLALEISLWPSSDGVWVCSHDQTTGRVFNSNLDIPSSTWATLSTLRSQSGGYPIARLEDVLNPLATGDRVFFIDDKPQTNATALLNLLDNYGGNSRFIAKGSGGSTLWADAASARGYKGWGYYYGTDVTGGALPASQSHWTMLGMDSLVATQPAWTAAKQYGKMVLAHIIASAAQKTQAQGYGADGYMISGVMEAVPQTGTAANLAGSGGLTVQVSQGYIISASLVGGGLLNAATSQAYSVPAGLVGSGSFSAVAGNHASAEGVFLGSGNFTAANPVQGLTVIASFSGVGGFTVVTQTQNGYAVYVWDGVSLVPASLGVWDGSHIVSSKILNIT